MPKISKEAEEQRKNMIVEGALDIFVEKGYFQATVDDIVKVSGISKGGIYNYFRSKEEIFLEIADRRFKLRNSLINRLPQDIGSREKVESYIDAVLEDQMKEETKKLARFTFEFWSVLSRSPHIADKSKDRYQLFYKDLASILNEGVSSGEFKEDMDVDSMIYIILSNLDGMGFFNSVMGIPINPDIIKNYRDMIMCKILK